MRDVCEELAVTPHVLRKLFLRNVGLTPKSYLRIERFRNAIRELTPEASLAELAAAADFSDQPHMTREIMHFAETTPDRLRKRVRPHAGHVLDP